MAMREPRPRTRSTTSRIVSASKLSGTIRPNSTTAVAAVVSRIMRSRLFVAIDLIAPLRPPLDALAGEQFDVWAGAALLDDVVSLQRLPGMLLLSLHDDVDLSAAGAERPHSSPRSEQDQLCYVPEIEAHAATVRASVFPNLVPDDIRFVREAPRLHDLQGLRQQCVRAPHVEVRPFGRVRRDRQGGDFLETHRLVAMQPLVLRGDLSRSILKAPG